MEPKLKWRNVGTNWYQAGFAGGVLSLEFQEGYGAYLRTIERCVLVFEPRWIKPIASAEAAMLEFEQLLLADVDEIREQLTGKAVTNG